MPCSTSINRALPALSRRQLLAAVCGAGLVLCAAVPTARGAQQPWEGVPADEPLRVAALKGPTAMGLVKLMDETDGAAQDGSDAARAYEFSIMAAPDEITPLLVKGELDIACVPANLASVLYNKTDGDVRVLAVNTLGVLYIVEMGDQVADIADLAGRTVFASGKGSTPEYALTYLLRANGLEPGEDVEVEWKSEHTECLASLLAAGEGAVALLPQPFVTSAQAKSPQVRVAIDLNDAWDACQRGEEEPSRLLTGVVLARAEVVEERPDAVDAFMADYAASVAYVNANVDEAAELVGAYGIIDAAVARTALPACNIVFIEGAPMRAALEGYLEVLYGQDPASVGGALPGDDFYYRGDERPDGDAAAVSAS